MVAPPWIRDIRFEPEARPLGRVNELIIHETVTTSHASTIRVLKRRGLSTQLTIDQHGVSRLTAELNTRALHCASHNGPSVGIDLVTPYYPPSGKATATWSRVIAAPWAHRGRYTLPTLASVGALVEVVRYLTSAEAGLQVPLTFVGVRPARDGIRFRMGLLDDSDVRRAGIWAHHQAGTHADGAWPALVCYLVLVQGRDLEAAYEEAAQLATGARGWVPLPSPAEAWTAGPVEAQRCALCGRAS